MAVQFIPGLGWEAPVTPSFPAGIPSPAQVLAFGDEEALATVRALHELFPASNLSPEQAARLGKAGAVLSLLVIGGMKYMALKQIGDMRQQYQEEMSREPAAPPPAAASQPDARDPAA